MPGLAVMSAWGHHGGFQKNADIVVRNILTGVLTDICVLHTAIDAYNLGYKLEIPAAAVASLTKENHDWALSHFQNVLGAKIIE